MRRKSRIDVLRSIIADDEISVANGATPQIGDDGKVVEDIATCGSCGSSWNDALITERTPTPSARCPYEYIHPEIAQLRKLERRIAPGCLNRTLEKHMGSRIPANAKAEARRRNRLKSLRIFTENVLRNEITTMKTKSPDWIITGGKDGALGTCTRCGDTLKISLPQSLTVLGASMKEFVKEHSDCPPEEPQA